jgi:hypothetical protein
VRERNGFHYFVAAKTLGLLDGRSWADVQHGITDAHVKEIHSCFEFIWPTDTNLTEFLPPHSRTISRAIYVGLLDPATVAQSMGCLTPYLDEIFVINPFLHAGIVNKEFSPLEHPSKYKEETLRNFLFIHELAPYIDSEVIQLIPDPLIFNYELRKEVGNMAALRMGPQQPSEREYPLFKKLWADRFRRFFFGLPEAVLKIKLKEFAPEKTPEEIDRLAKYMRTRNERDPLALISTDQSAKMEGIWTFQMKPNLELGLFISEIVGAIPYTDLSLRWAELKTAAESAENADEHLSTCLSSISFPFELNSLVNLQFRSSDSARNIRETLKQLMNERDAPDRALCDRLRASAEGAKSEMMVARRRILEKYPNAQTRQFTGTIDFFAPPNGIARNTVRRLLLTHGTDNPLSKVLGAFRFNNGLEDSAKASAFH